MSNSKVENIPIDREKRLILLRWLKSGIIDGEELNQLQGESKGHRMLSMQEAQDLLRKIEESY